MTLRRVLIAGAVMCGVCVWGFARSGDESAAAQSLVEPVAREAGDDEEDAARDEAVARYRTNQSRHWRHVALGSGTSH